MSKVPTSKILISKIEFDEILESNNIKKIEMVLQDCDHTPKKGAIYKIIIKNRLFESGFGSYSTSNIRGAVEREDVLLTENQYIDLWSRGVRLNLIKAKNFPIVKFNWAKQSVIRMHNYWEVLALFGREDAGWSSKELRCLIKESVSDNIRSMAYERKELRWTKKLFDTAINDESEDVVSTVLNIKKLSEFKINKDSMINLINRCAENWSWVVCEGMFTREEFLQDNSLREMVRNLCKAKPVLEKFNVAVSDYENRELKKSITVKTGQSYSL